MDIAPVALLHHLRKDLRRSFPDLDLDSSEMPQTANEVAAWLLYRNLCKKHDPRDETKVSDMAEAATLRFIGNNDHCSSYRDPEAYSYELCEIRTIMNRLPSLNWGKIFQFGRCGPGASVGSRARNSALEKLFFNRITTTSPALYNVYRRILASFPSLRIAEELRIRGLKKGYCKVVAGSKFSTVPKDSTRRRGICTEPSLNMFFQLGLGEILNNFLSEEFGYDPRLQPDRNRDLARTGSLTGELCTIDLADASDLASFKFVLSSLYYRGDWQGAIEDIRSPYVELPDGSTVEAHMVSSMGNGFTFPLETLLFSAIVKAVALKNNVSLTRMDADPSVCNFGVFGDDIICPARIFHEVCDCLEAFGFRVNRSKSFGAGKFRESCGTDWYDGTNVRAVYIKRLDRESDLFSSVNMLNIWSARHLVPLRSTIRYLLPRGWPVYAIPTDEDPSSGVYVPYGMSGGPNIYTCKRAVAKTQVVWARRKIRPRFASNPYGVLIAAASGWLSSGLITRRCDEPDRVEVKGTTPCWVRYPNLHEWGVSYEAWTTLTHYNLVGL